MRSRLPLVLVAWAACVPRDKAGDGAPPVDTSARPPDTDATPAVTGCYDVPMALTGGHPGDGFRPIADGDVLPLTHGEQGGASWHLSAGLRVEHTHENVSVFTTVTLVSTGEMISGVQGLYDPNVAYVKLVPAGECAGDLWDARALLDDLDPGPTGGVDLSDICALEGEEARIDWSVADLSDGRTATATATVVLTMDDDDVAACAALR